MQGHVAVLSPDKDHLRKRVWERMQAERVARFPGAWGRIPNFAGASAAAERVRELDIWRRARVIKCNPDAPQLPLRRLALREGKLLYMAVPRLRQEACFLELDPGAVDPVQASSIKGASRLGRAVLPEEMPGVDLVVCGSVAAHPDGGRLGKGGGYSDLEFALLVEMGKLAPDVPVLTSVHDSQVLDEPLPMTAHDISLDFIVTPTRAISCPRAYPRPEGIIWDLLPRERIAEIPVLQRLERALAGGSTGPR